MNYLAIDTSGAYLTVAASKDGNKAVSFIENCNLRHSVILMGEVEKVLAELNMNASEADYFACAVGAGSFTGIRIGVATIKAFAYSFNKPVLGVTSFDCLAYNSGIEGKYVTVIDARHDNYYACLYDGVKPIETPEFINGEKLGELAKSYTLVSYTALENFKSKSADVKIGFINAVESLTSNITRDREQLVPLYIRKSQAEENV